jgi:predicted membrane channel-forming protein YqfA (hemolysin III family)
MDTWLRVVMAVLGTLIALGIVVVFMSRTRNRETTASQPNYRMFFFIGGAMSVVGIAEILVLLQTDISFVIALPLLAIGLVFLTVGLANRDKWRK